MWQARRVQSGVRSAGLSADAVILVGGLGTRLRPLTLSAPKPMLPTAGVPFLTHLITRLRDAGVAHIVLGTSYRPAVFEKHFGDGGALGVELEYVVETEPLGTGGGIRNVANRLRSDAVIICNGDNLVGVDLAHLVHGHRERAAEVTICLTKVSDPRSYGCVPTDADGRVQAFLEKDPNPVTDQINAGIYVFDRAVIDAIPTGRPVSVERETFPGLLASGRRVFGVVQHGYWRDFGTPADFVEGSADLVRGVAPSAAVPKTGDYLMLPGARVDETAKLSGGSAIGHHAVVGPGARVDASVIFDGARIAAGAVIRHSVIGAGAHVGADTVVEDAVIGDRAVLGAALELRAGIRVWPDVELADGAVRFSTDG